MSTMTTQSTPPEQAPAAEASAMVVRLQRERRRGKITHLSWAILTPVALLVLWEVACQVGWLDARFFPPPSSILVQSVEFITDPTTRAQLLTDIRSSGLRLAIGFSLGTVLGLAFGLLMGLIPAVRYAFSSIISATYPLPKLALFPLMIIFFGIGNTSMVALVTLGVFFMVCINTVAGVVYSAPIYSDVAQAFRVPRSTRVLRVTLPAAIPSVIGGLRLGFGQALIIVISTEIIVISTEFVGGENGVGYMIWNSWQILNVSAMFTGLAIVGLVGWLGSLLITRLGRVMVPWQDD
jgi:ABC-type nitrate/sulfonate/bicarbonate transport system permease component